MAETFHRAIDGSETSIVRDPTFQPTLGPNANTFRMVDLLLFAFEGKQKLLTRRLTSTQRCSPRSPRYHR